MEVLRDGSWLRVQAPAKLNLFLEVLGKRVDGFHEIETLMTAISICDTLFVKENSEGRIQLSCEWASGMEARRRRLSDGTLGDLPSETDNIVFKAADRLRHRAGVGAGATIHLVKRIPSAAGLGGASSDAAAALAALNRLWQLRWSAAELGRLASEIGSDVPFFLAGTGSGAHAAVCRGRGEKLELESGIPLLHFVVAKPPAGLSTATVYSRCTVAPGLKLIAPLRAALRCGSAVDVGRRLFNRLQETAEQLCPWVDRLRLCFERTDVLGHQMSGSGTSYFGICRSARHARHVAARLRGARLGEVFYATTRPAL